MMLHRRVSPLLACSFLLFLATCQDDTGPVDPTILDVSPSMTHVTQVNIGAGISDDEFFFRPPIDDDGNPTDPLDTAVKPFLTLEVCRSDGLSDPFSSVCQGADQLDRWTDSEGFAGQTIEIQSGDAFDFYSVVLKLNQYDEAFISQFIGEVLTARVMIGDPDGAFFVPGFFQLILVESGSEQDPDAEPPKFRVGDLPVKFFLGGFGTFELWQLDSQDPEDICFPINDCTLNAGVSGGLEMGPLALGEVADIIGGNQILVVCVDIDLDVTPNPLGVSLPQVEQFVDCGFTPSFGTLQDNTFDVELCIVEGTEDQDAFVGGHLRESDGVVEFLRKGSDPGGIFSADNCENFDPLAADAGFLDRIRYAALDRVLRPVARFLGPEPLRAYDRTRWSSASDSPFGPVLRLDVLPNEGPAPAEPTGKTVTASVCVGTPHLDPPVAPGPGNQVEILFEVVAGGDNGGKIEGSGAMKTVSTALRNKEPGDDCEPTDGSGQIAEASVQWMLSSAVELNELRASIPKTDDQGNVILEPGAFAEVIVNMDDGVDVVPLDDDASPNTLSHTFSTHTVEPLAMCPVSDDVSYTAFDEFGGRGFYIVPSAFEIVGDDLLAVTINLSSNNKSAGGQAGTYVVELAARRGTYEPGVADLGTATATVTLSGNPPEMKPVTFIFDNPISLLAEEDLPPGAVGPEIAFVGTILDAPKKNARLWFLAPDLKKIDGFPQRGDLACTGAIVTNGTTFTTPLDTNRRQGMYIEVLGVDNPNP